MHFISLLPLLAVSLSRASPIYRPTYDDSYGGVNSDALVDATIQASTPICAYIDAPLKIHAGLPTLGLLSFGRIQSCLCLDTLDAWLDAQLSLTSAIGQLGRSTVRSYITALIYASAKASTQCLIPDGLTCAPCPVLPSYHPALTATQTQTTTCSSTLTSTRSSAATSTANSTPSSTPVSTNTAPSHTTSTYVTSNHIPTRTSVHSASPTCLPAPGSVINASLLIELLSNVKSALQLGYGSNAIVDIVANAIVGVDMNVDTSLSAWHPSASIVADTQVGVEVNGDIDASLDLKSDSGANIGVDGNVKVQTGLEAGIKTNGSVQSKVDTDVAVGLDLDSDLNVDTAVGLGLNATVVVDQGGSFGLESSLDAAVNTTLDASVRADLQNDLNLQIDASSDTNLAIQGETNGNIEAGLDASVDLNANTDVQATVDVDIDGYAAASALIGSADTNLNEILHANTNAKLDANLNLLASPPLASYW